MNNSGNAEPTVYIQTLEEQAELVSFDSHYLSALNLFNALQKDNKSIKVYIVFKRELSKSKAVIQTYKVNNTTHRYIRHPKNRVSLLTYHDLPWILSRNLLKATEFLYEDWPGVSFIKEDYLGYYIDSEIRRRLDWVKQADQYLEQRKDTTLHCRPFSRLRTHNRIWKH